jgi:hypothetical protein
MAFDPETGGTGSYAKHTDGDGGTLSNDEQHLANRKSRLFFGICDMRTAAVALDVLNICFTAVVAVVLILMFVIQGGPFVMRNIFLVIGGGLLTAGVSGIGLLAAMNWHLVGMGLATVGFAALLVVRIIHLEYVDIVVTALLLFPHAMLTMEMQSGILTKETFEKEEYIVEGGREIVEMAHGYISPNVSMQQ